MKKAKHAESHGIYSFVTGKTELTKRLTEFMFNTETALIRLDMSEYA